MDGNVQRPSWFEISDLFDLTVLECPSGSSIISAMDIHIYIVPGFHIFAGAFTSNG